MFTVGINYGISAFLKWDPSSANIFPWKQQELTVTATLCASVQVTGTFYFWKLLSPPSCSWLHVRLSDSTSQAVAAWIKVGTWPKLLVFELGFWDSQRVFACGCRWEDRDSRPQRQLFSHRESKKSAWRRTEQIPEEAESRGDRGPPVILLIFQFSVSVFQRPLFLDTMSHLAVFLTMTCFCLRQLKLVIATNKIWAKNLKGKISAKQIRLHCPKSSKVRTWLGCLGGSVS